MLERCRLYVIVDRDALAGRDPAAVAEQVIAGGADLIQWRDKRAGEADFLETARRLRALTRERKVPLVINDRLEAALECGADFLHVGHTDLPVSEARRQAGGRLGVGRSTHSIEEARQAVAEGADYIGIGPVFATPTKPDTPAVGLELVRAAAREISVPWFAIGGIDREKIALVSSAGATRVAVVRAVTAAADPKAAAQALKSLLNPATGGMV